MNNLKKLIYKSHYRGTKEGDFLLSAFAKTKLVNFTENEIKAYETLLDYTDAQIHEWVFSPSNAPEYFKPIILKISQFHRTS